MGALSLSSPKQSPAFRASPHHHPHPPQCPEGPVSGGNEPKARGDGQEATPPPHSLGRLGRWAPGREWPRLPGGRGRAVCGRTWNSGSMRPAQGKGHAACPLLGSTCPATAAGGCPPFLALPPRASYMQRHTGARSCMRPHTRSRPHI